MKKYCKRSRIFKYKYVKFCLISYILSHTKYQFIMTLDSQCQGNQVLRFYTMLERPLGGYLLAVCRTAAPKIKLPKLGV